MLKNGGKLGKFTPKSGYSTDGLMRVMALSLIGFDNVKEPRDDGKSPACRTAEIRTCRKSCSNC